MAKAKKKSVLGFVLFGLVAVALALVIVGMCVDVIQVTASQSNALTGSSSKTSFIKLFGEEWANFKEAEVASNVFLMVSFIVTIVGLALLAVDGVLRLFLNKNCIFCRIIGAALTLIGAILILVAGLTVAGTLTEKLGASGGLGDLFSGEVKYTAAAGVWLGFVGGLVGAVAGALPVSKKFA